MGHPPQGSIEDNGEGQKNHGGSTANLGNPCEGLHGDLVQDRPLWANPQPGPHQLEARPTYPQRTWLLPGSPPSLGQEPGHLQNCWDQDGWAVTSSSAKKVRWSQRQTVPLAPTSVEQPLEDQSPADPGEEGRRL